MDDANFGRGRSDGDIFDTIGIGPLGPGETRTLQMSGISIVPGVEMKKACYEGDDFPELSTTNNCTSIGDLTVNGLN